MAEGEAAGELFAQCLCSLHVQGQRSAKSLCILSWWASRAGAKGPAKDYASRPNAPSGHYQRHLDMVHGARISDLRQTFYKIQVPRYQKWDGGRTASEMPVQLPHELLPQELIDDTALVDELNRLKRSNHWPKTYTDHDVVKRHPEAPVVPCFLYVDGVPTTKRTGVCGFWVGTLVGSRRHLVAMLRKSDLCACGCRGWCSCWPVFNVVAWSFNALAKNQHPLTDHLDRPWSAGEERGARAGNPLGFYMALTEVRGDWMEFCATFGMVSWASSLYPCFACGCTRETMHNYYGLSATTSPWPRASLTEYNDACSKCELVRTLSRADHLLLKPHVRSDTRPGGSRGRRLVKDFPSLNLLKGDRLEPSKSLQAVGQFESISEFLLTVIFWRPSEDTRTRHRNPIMVADGLTLTHFVVDLLHAVHLGIAQDFCGAVFWHCITSGLFVTGRSPSETAQISVQHLRSLLWSWYSNASKELVGAEITRLEDLTVSMLGTAASPACKTKGAETRWLIPFCVHLLSEYKDPLGQRGKTLARVGRALLDLVEEWQVAPRRLLAPNLQRMSDAMLTLLRFWTEASLPKKPKLHLVSHLVSNSALSGNPSFHALWLDESLSRTLANICKAAHTSVWEYRVFVYFAKSEVDRLRKRPRGA